MKSHALVLFVAATVIGGCDADSFRSTCGMYPTIIPAIVVEVYVATTGEPAAEQAVGYVADGDYRDELQLYQRTDTGRWLALSGAYNRPGRYFVSVSHPDYQTWTRSGVYAGLTSDECTVDTQVLRADLVP